MEDSSLENRFNINIVECKYISLNEILDFLRVLI